MCELRARRWAALWLVSGAMGCRAATESAPAAAPVVAGPSPAAADCEAALTSGPGPRSWVKTCDADGRRLVTCWAGHRAVVATCARCTTEGALPRCEAPEVNLSALLERDLAAGLARCAGRLRYSARLRVDDRAWVIDTTKSPPTVAAEEAGQDVKVDVTASISRAHLVDLVADSEWDGMRMFFAGRMRIDGNQRAGVDLSSWLSLPRSVDLCAADAGE